MLVVVVAVVVVGGGGAAFDVANAIHVNAGRGPRRKAALELVTFS